MREMDVPEVLRQAKADAGDVPEGADPDTYRVCLAVKWLYPKEIEKCKAKPGYTPELLTFYIQREIAEWAGRNAPGLYRALMLKLYAEAGMKAENAKWFVEYDLNARTGV
jgi:hypothetical protein